MMQAKQQGFTLLELMITVAIIGILAVIAVPSYHRLMASTKMQTVLGEFRSTLFMAQKEAIRSKRDISVCPSTDGVSCNAPPRDFSVGWIVIQGLPADNNPVLIKDYPPLDAAGKIKHQLGQNITGITFKANGRVALNSAGFSVSVAHEDYDDCLTLVVSRGGSMRTEKSGKSDNACKVR